MARPLPETPTGGLGIGRRGRNKGRSSDDPQVSFHGFILSSASREGNMECAIQGVVAKM
jgi:hypothetical protein